jgi:hypothetical protein
LKTDQYKLSNLKRGIRGKGLGKEQLLRDLFKEVVIEIFSKLMEGIHF